MFMKLFLKLYMVTTYFMRQSPSWEVTGSQVVKEFPSFHGNRSFITALKSAHHLSLS